MILNAHLVSPPLCPSCSPPSSDPQRPSARLSNAKISCTLLMLVFTNRRYTPLQFRQCHHPAQPRLADFSKAMIPLLLIPYFLFANTPWILHHLIQDGRLACVALPFVSWIACSRLNCENDVTNSPVFSLQLSGPKPRSNIFTTRSLQVLLPADPTTTSYYNHQILQSPNAHSWSEARLLQRNRCISRAAECDFGSSIFVLHHRT